MRKTLLILAIVCAAIMSCNGGKNGASHENDTLSVDSQMQEPFTYDSISIEKKDTALEVSIRVDYPTGGPHELIDTLLNFIADELHVARKDAKDRKRLLNAAVEKGREMMLPNREEQLEFMGEETPTYYYNYNIKVEAETEDYITYTVAYEEYQGGAHGGYVITGTTFYKSNAHRLDWNSFKNTSSKAFQKILKDGLYDYFGEYNKGMTDADLKDILIVVEDINNIPRPQFAPYLIPRGIVFTYQQYEIAAYAAGLPSFIVPYEKISSFLKKP